jgi:PIN like domain
VTPDHSPVFFLDRNLGRNIVAAALRDVGMLVEVQDDHFAHDTTDEVRLAEVGKRGWFVITLDERIRYRKVELEALRYHRVGAFLLVRWRGSTAVGLADALIHARAAMLRLTSKRRRPFIAKVYGDGKATLWETFENR